MKKFKKYDVHITITATKTVTASSFDEAEKEANFYIGEYDFGELHDIDWTIDASSTDANDELGTAKI